jgi:hypothetical protein
VPVVIRPATPDDLKAVARDGLCPTVKALAVETEAGLLGLLGFTLKDGRYWAFCDITSAEASPFKLRLARAVLRLFDEMRDAGVTRIYTEADPEEPRAPLWLSHLGFVPDPWRPGLYLWMSQ